MSRSLDNLTLVILTHNDPAYLARSLDYHSDLNCRKLIADSSTSPELDEATAPAGYEHLHLPVIYMKKFGEVMQRVETPYVAFVGCDDFLVPQALDAGCAFLDDHRSYVAATGQHVGFSSDGAAYTFFLRHSMEFLNLIARGDIESVHHRLNVALTPPYGMLYSVMRADAFRGMTNSEFMQNPLTFTTLFDRFVQMGFAIEGNVKMLNELFSGRSTEKGKPNDHSFKHINDLLQEWPEGSREQYARMITSLAERMRAVSGLSTEVCQTTLNNIVFRSQPRMRTMNQLPGPNTHFQVEEAEKMDEALAAQQRLVVRRVDKFKMPFPEAELLFPVYQNLDAVRRMASAVDRHPVERLNALKLD